MNQCLSPCFIRFCKSPDPISSPLHRNASSRRSSKLTLCFPILRWCSRFIHCFTGGIPSSHCSPPSLVAQECLQLQRALMDLQSSIPSIEQPGRKKRPSHCLPSLQLHPICGYIEDHSSIHHFDPSQNCFWLVHLIMKGKIG